MALTNLRAFLCYLLNPRLDYSIFWLSIIQPYYREPQASSLHQGWVEYLVTINYQ